MGFVRADVAWGHPDFGRAMPCRCRLEATRRREYERALAASCLADLGEQTFASFQARAQPEAFLAAQAFVREPDGWLLLVGLTGTGKSHLLAGIGHALLEAGRRPVMTVTPEWLGYLRAGYEKGAEDAYEERLRQVRECDVLLLDDLGAEYETSWAREQVFLLLDYRARRRLPSVVATNVQLEQMPDRIRSRLSDVRLVRRVAMRPRDVREQGLPR